MRVGKIIGCLVFCLALFHSQVKASEITPAVSDSVASQSYVYPDLQFKPKQLILPAGLIAVGVAGCYWDSFKKFNRKVNNEMQKWSGGHKIVIDDWLQYLPAAGYLALGFYKSKRKFDFKERISVELTAYLCSSILVNVTKYSIKEARPSGYRNSFPSGHTAIAFTGAELIRREFGWGLGSAAYAVATGVAFLRLYNNRHWLNDVIGGAGIGILSANVGYWMLPLYRKWFHWNPQSSTGAIALMPAYDGNAVTLNFACRF